MSNHTPPANTTVGERELRLHVSNMIAGVWSIAVGAANKRDDEYLVFKDATVADVTEWTMKLLQTELKKFADVVIGDDYPAVTQRYSGGVWLGDTQLNWTDVERAKRHFLSRNAEKAEARQRADEYLKGLK